MSRLTIVHTVLCSTNSRLTVTMYAFGSTGFGHLGLSSRKWCSYSASSPHLSSAINSYSIVDLVITICFEDFHDTTAPPNVKT